MSSELYHHLSQLIHHYYTWVDVLDTDREESFAFHTTGSFHAIHCRVLRLVVKWPNYNYDKGQCWSIPEFDLRNAIRSLNRNESFRKRCGNLQLNFQDVEEIIFNASHRLIRLDLEP